MYIRIKELRKKFNLSEKQLAEFLNISVQIYVEYESGKKQIPVHILSKLAKKYQTSIDYLIGDTDTFTPHKNTNS